MAQAGLGGLQSVDQIDPEAHRVVIALVQREPAERGLLGRLQHWSVLNPLAQQGRLAIARWRGEQYEAPARAQAIVQLFEQPRTHDQFGPKPQLEAVFTALAEPKRLIWIEAEDHFFAGALNEFEEAVFSLAPEGRQ